MAKIEIEVPDGKAAHVSQNDDKVIVTFEEVNPLDRLKDFGSVLNHLLTLGANGVEWASEIVTEYTKAKPGSYSEKLTAYRMVVAALTNNEKRHLTTGECWFPIIQFCHPNTGNCWGKEIVGRIKSEGQEFLVVGGDVYDGAAAGLGNFNSYNGVSYSYATVGFRSVSSKEVALHISKYFGKLLFEVHYGGMNCDWVWVN